MRRQTITPVPGEQKLYQRPDTPLRGRAPAESCSAAGRLRRSLPPPPRRHLSGLAARQPPHRPALAAPCVLLSAHHRLKRARQLRRLSVPGHVASSMKEGPSCPHSLSAEFSPQIPATAAWKGSPDRCGAGARRSLRGWARLGHPVVRVGRHLPVSTRTGRQAGQLPSPWDCGGPGSRRSSGSRLPRKDCQLHAPELPVCCLMPRLCDLNSLSRTLRATRLEESTGIV